MTIAPDPECKLCGGTGEWEVEAYEGLTTCPCMIPEDYYRDIENETRTC
jgi:hypothetical protein